MDRLLAIVAFLLPLGRPPSTAACEPACSCAGERDIGKARDRATAVLEAIALDSTLGAPFDSVQGLFTVRLAVGQVWKGDVSDTIRVVTREPRGACGFYFVQRERHLVFAYRTPAGQLEVTMCSPSAPWATPRPRATTWGSHRGGERPNPQMQPTGRGGPGLRPGSYARRRQTAEYLCSTCRISSWHRPPRRWGAA